MTTRTELWMPRDGGMGRNYEAESALSGVDRSASLQPHGNSVSPSIGYPLRPPEWVQQEHWLLDREWMGRGQNIRATHTDSDEAGYRLELRVPPFRTTAIACGSHRLAKLARVPTGLVYVMWLIAAALSLGAAPNGLAQVPAPARVWMPFSHVGAGFTVGTTGIGAEIAVPYGAYWNIRAGASYLSYSRTFQNNGYPVEGHLRLGGARLSLDWFPQAGGFHVSVGVLVPNLTQATARLNLKPGDVLTIQGTDYTTDSTNPFQGTGRTAINKAAPLFTVGWGNLLPRNYRKRFSFPIEVGVAYQGAPTAHVTTAGDICTGAQICRLAVSDPGFNQNLNSAIRELDGNLDSYARFFPVISTGIGYRF
jgi:hypothetical protein